jgi:hypothetical protein
MFKLAGLDSRKIDYRMPRHSQRENDVAITMTICPEFLRQIAIRPNGQFPEFRQGISLYLESSTNRFRICRAICFTTSILVNLLFLAVTERIFLEIEGFDAMEE